MERTGHGLGGGGGDGVGDVDVGVTGGLKDGGEYGVAGFSFFLTTKYMMSPINPVISTMMTHSPPFIPRDSAFRYTQMQSIIGMM